MTVGVICNREVDRARPDETIRVAADRMLQRNVGTLFVCDDGGEPVGILTDRDVTLRVVAKGLDPATAVVGDVMNRVYGSVEEETPIATALSVMRAGGFRRLPVMDAGRRLVGVVSLDDVLIYLADATAMIKDLIRKEGPNTLR